MDMRTAEEMALDAASKHPRYPELHSTAFHWAFKKKADHKVSPEFRKRAADIARRIWEAKGHK